MSKFGLDGLNSGELCYLYIYGKKTENNEHEIECASNLVELEWLYFSSEEMKV